METFLEPYVLLRLYSFFFLNRYVVCQRHVLSAIVRGGLVGGKQIGYAAVLPVIEAAGRVTIPLQTYAFVQAR